MHNLFIWKSLATRQHCYQFSVQPNTYQQRNQPVPTYPHSLSRRVEGKKTRSKIDHDSTTNKVVGSWFKVEIHFTI